MSTETVTKSSQKSTNVRFIQGSVLGLLRGFFRVFGRLTPGFAAWLAERLFTTPPRHRRPRRERRWLEGAVRSAAPGPRGPLTVWTWEAAPAAGSGDDPRGTVLLVHGWGGRGSQLGAFAEPLREAGFRVVAFDAFGHGDSGRGRSSLPEVIEDLRAVAAAVGPLAGLVAHSLGGGATAYALRHGLEVERLVFIAPGLDPVAYLDQFHRMVGVPYPVLERMRQRLEERFDIPWSEFKAVDHPQPHPLLIVHDRLDSDTPCWGSRDLAARWPRARLVTVSGLGHTRILRAPEVVQRGVEFLAAAGESRNGERAGGDAAPSDREAEVA